MILIIDNFVFIPNILFSFFVNPAANYGPLSDITLSGNPCNFHTWSLNNLTNPSTIVFSVITTKWDIFKNLLHITKIESWFFDTGSFVIKSTDIYYHSFSGTLLDLNFPASISALFFILWHWLHPSTYCFTSFVIPGHQ